MDRNDAAAKAMSSAWRNIHTNEALGFQNMLAQHAIAASDAVMFSDDTLKNAEAALEKEFTVEHEVGEYDATAVYGTPAEIVRAVIEALKKA
jgi:fructose-specific phosphotransferase system component IIB